MVFYVESVKSLPKIPLNCGVKLDSRSLIKFCSLEKWYASYLLIYSLTPRRRVLLEKLAVSHLLKNFPTFYSTRMFIFTFTNARHMPLSWVISIQYMPLHLTFWISILITLSHLRLGLPSGNFPSVFRIETQYMTLQVNVHASCPSKFILLGFINRKILGEVYVSLNT